MNRLKNKGFLFTILLTISIFAPLLAAQAAEPEGRYFSVTLTPSAIDIGQSVQFTFLITNDPSSTDNIGSINLTVPLGFRVVTQPVIASPSGNWITTVQTEAKIAMKPSSPQEALPPGQTISIVFNAIAPSLPGTSTWTTQCNTNTGIGGIAFALTPGTQQPIVITNPALVPPSISAFPNVIDQSQASSLTSSTVTTGSAPYMYQWFQKGPSETVYSVVVGATSSSYIFQTGIGTETGTWSFKLGVIDAAGATVNSTEGAFVLVNPALVAPVVTASASTVIQGQTSSLTSSSMDTGTAPYVFQWFVKSPIDSGFVLIEGATSTDYVFSTTSSTVTGTWNYALRVIDYTEASVTSNVVNIVVGVGQYVITATAGPNGAINPFGNVNVDNGVDQVFTITPNAGYHVADVIVDGISVGSVTSYEFNSVAGDHTIAVDFTINTYTITVIQSENGVITPGTSLINHGGTPSFIVTPDVGYQIEKVLVDGVPVSLDEQSQYIFPAVDASHMLTATFMLKTNTISASAELKGAISPSGNVIVDYGADQSFIITPALNYHISDVVIDGISVGQVGAYTFLDVVSNHTIQASFEIDDLVIIAEAGPNGAVSPSGTVYVVYAGSQAFTFTPSNGYHVADVIVDGTPIGAQTSYTFNNVVKGHTIAVTFGVDAHKITASAGSGGFIAPENEVVVNHGADQTFLINAAEGYHITEVFVDGISVDAVDSYTFNGVVEDHSIYATFSVNQYTITVVSPYGSPTPSALVNEGQDFTVLVTSPEGDWLNRWVCTGYSIDSTPVTQGTSYTFVSVQANHTIVFNWQEQFYVAVVSPDGTVDGSGWYNSGATITFSIPNEVIPGDDGTQQVFSGWSGDASGTGLTSNPIQVDGPKTVTTNWKTQYYLTVVSDRGTPAGEGWYDKGSTATFGVETSVAGSSDTRYVFNSWTGSDGVYTGSATSTVLMKGPITETASWATQYRVVYVASGNALQIAVPPIEWVAYGAEATGKFLTMLTNSAKDTRCNFTGDNRTDIVTKPMTVTGTYQTQYMVKFAQDGIASDASGPIVTILGVSNTYAQLADVTWVPANASVVFEYTEVVETSSAGKQYVLRGVNATSPLTITGPTIVLASYGMEKRSSLSTIAASALLLLALALLALLLLARRRKKKITPIADEGGSINPSTTQKVNRGGESPTFHITARKGYEIADVVIDKALHLGAVKTHRFTNVTRDHVISVRFQKI